ncbi:hypothetical protein JNUCC74_10325 [Cerasibacillus sp. JNUCC 74]
MKQPVRVFAMGLLTAGVIMLGVYFFSNGNIQTADNLSDEELVTLIEEKGYHVLSDSEYVALSVDEQGATDSQDPQKEEQPTSKAKAAEKTNDEQNRDKQKEADNNKDQEDKEKDKEQEDKNKTYTLKIKSGMPSSDISDLLEENNIIDDASEFNKYLEKHNYSEKVQLGKFKVSSDMSLYEIAEAITK